MDVSSVYNDDGNLIGAEEESKQMDQTAFIDGEPMGGGAAGASMESIDSTGSLMGDDDAANQANTTW